MMNYGKKLQAISRQLLTVFRRNQPGEPGRANQLSAKAYLAKAMLYQAYTQDDNYNVTGIDHGKAYSR